jgi:putative peptidoglycan lipid II flippase
VSNRHKLNTKASGIIALAVMCSRVLGLVREVLFSAIFGSQLLGIFLVAFRAPNLLRDLFAEGALSTAFITVFSRRIETAGPNAAWKLASKMLTLATVFMSGVTLLGIFCAEPLIGVLAWGFDPQFKELTVQLTQIMFPFILLVSLAALVMGILNSRDVFGAPAMASSFFNIGSIVGGLALAWWLDPSFFSEVLRHLSDHHEKLPPLPFGEKALVGLSIGTLIGGLLQLVTQLPSLRRVGFSFRPDFRWRDPGVREVLVLMVPSVIAASAVQVNVLINTSFASSLGPSAVTWLNNAFRLMQLPIGIFGVAVATITLPVVSRIAANADRSAFGPTLGKALRLAIFLTLPSAVGLYFLAHPIISVIYEHRNFLANDALNSAFALQFYAMGLVAYSGIKVLSPAFYAINRKWTPMLVSFASIALNIVLNWLFIFHLGLGHRGLALSTAISATLNFVTLYALMIPAAGTLDTPRLLATLARCAIAAAVLGAICWAATTWLHGWLFGAAFLVRVGVLFAVIAIAGGAYFGLCLLLRVEATQDALGAVLRKLRRRAG